MSAVCHLCRQVYLRRVYKRETFKPEPSRLASRTSRGASNPLRVVS